jgi:hypothetical protein
LPMKNLTVTKSALDNITTLQRPIKYSSKKVCFDLSLENQNLGDFSGEVGREDCFVLKKLIRAFLNSESNKSKSCSARLTSRG